MAGLASREETRIRVDAPSASRLSSLQEAPVRTPAPAAAGKPAGSRRLSRLIRWTIGLALLAEAGWLVAPTVLYRTSVRATITAPLTVVRVPQRGLVLGTPPAVGTRVEAGQTLFELQTAAPDQRPLEQIRAEITSLRRTAAALKGQLAEMDALKATLSQHFSDYREARIGQAERQAAEQAARVNAAASRLKSAEFEHRMYQRLSSRGASSDTDRTRAEYALEQARHELEVAQHTATRMQLQLDAARKGLFVGEADGGQDRVASRQRCDEIEIQQAGLRARLGELDGRILEQESRLASEEQHLTEGRVPVVAPTSGVVWMSTLAPGVEVAAGSTALELVDPDRLGIEADFKDGDAERVLPGVRVKVRPTGTSRILAGRVVRVSEPGMADEEVKELAARVAASPGTFRALIKLDELPGGGGLENRYHIGESAAVWMSR